MPVGLLVSPCVAQPSLKDPQQPRGGVRQAERRCSQRARRVSNSAEVQAAAGQTLGAFTAPDSTDGVTCLQDDPPASCENQIQTARQVSQKIRLLRNLRDTYTRYSFVLLLRAVCMVSKKTLGSLKMVSFTVGLLFVSFLQRVATVKSHKLSSSQSLTRAFRESRTSLLNPFSRGLPQQQRERTEGTHAACVGGGGDELKKKKNKTGSVLLVAHKSGGAFAVFPPLPPLAPHARETQN